MYATTSESVSGTPIGALVVFDHKHPGVSSLESNLSLYSGIPSFHPLEYLPNSPISFPSLGRKFGAPKAGSAAQRTDRVRPLWLREAIQTGDLHSCVSFFQSLPAALSAASLHLGSPPRFLKGTSLRTGLFPWSLLHVRIFQSPSCAPRLSRTCPCPDPPHHNALPLLLAMSRVCGFPTSLA